MRVLVVWHQHIFPHLRSGRKILFAAHGNTLRALVKYLEVLPDDEIAELNIPTGILLIYEFNPVFQVMARYSWKRTCRSWPWYGPPSTDWVGCRHRSPSEPDP